MIAFRTCPSLTAFLDKKQLICTSCLRSLETFHFLSNTESHVELRMTMLRVSLLLKAEGKKNASGALEKSCMNILSSWTDQERERKGATTAWVVRLNPITECRTGSNDFIGSAEYIVLLDICSTVPPWQKSVHRVVKRCKSYNTKVFMKRSSCESKQRKLKRVKRKTRDKVVCCHGTLALVITLWYLTTCLSAAFQWLISFEAVSNTQKEGTAACSFQLKLHHVHLETIFQYHEAWSAPELCPRYQSAQPSAKVALKN